MSNFGLYISGDLLWKTTVIVLELLGYCYPVKNMRRQKNGALAHVFPSSVIRVLIFGNRRRTSILTMKVKASQK